jgi:hypothetical protein
MVSAAIYDHDARKRSYALLAEVGRALEPARGAAFEAA